MVDEVKIPVGVEGSDEAVRDLRKVDEAAKSLDKTTSKATDGLNQTGKQAGDVDGKMSGAAVSADKLTRSLVGMVGAASLIGKITSAMAELFGMINRTGKAAAQLANSGSQLNKAASGAAAQFDVDEDVMSNELAMIGKMSGSDDMAALGSLSIAMSSTGQVGGMSGGRFSQADRSNLATVSAWLGRKNAGSVAGSVVSALARMRAAMPEKSYPQLLGMLGDAYKKSESSDWSDFLGGMTSTYGIMAQGMDPIETIGWYAGQFQFAKSGTAAGETVRLVHDNVVAPGKSDLISVFDNYYGQGTYGRLYTSDRAELYRRVVTMFASKQGMDRLQMFEQADIPLEARTRIQNLISGLGTTEAVSASLPSSDASREISRWLQTSRPTLAAAGMQSAAEQAASGNAQTDLAAALAVAESERKNLEVANPAALWWNDATRLGDNSEQTGLVLRRIYRVLEQHGISRRQFRKMLPLGPETAGGYHVADPVQWLAGGNLGTHSDLSFDFVPDTSLRGDLKSAVGLGNTYNGGTHYHNNDRVSPAGRAEPMKGVAQ